MDNEILVSVIIPCYNGENYLAEAIQSIRNQSQPVFEIIVVDDGSDIPVESLELTDKSSLRIVRQQNKGQGSALNLGLTLALGTHVAFLDHDDIWDREKNKRQTRLARDSDVVIGQVINEWIKDGITYKRQHMGNARIFGACLFRKDVFTTIGPIVQDHQIHEVIDWWSRAGNKLSIDYSNNVDLIRRIHGENQTLQKAHLDRAHLLRRVRENLARNNGRS